MLPPPLRLQCTEKLPDELGELEMYSVRFVMSVARKRAHHKIDRQQNHFYRFNAGAPASASPDDLPVPGLDQDRHLD